MGQPVVWLGQPMRPDGRPQLVSMLAAERCTGRGVPVTRMFAATSLLPFTFNTLWAGALNARKDGATHFAMLHDDVQPLPGWLDVLMDELAAHDAEIVSAVVPIKDDRGLTSTALDTTGDPWNPRRLTLAEVFERPETFTHESILLNTGLWVCRLDRPWCDRVWFRQTDRIVRKPDGSFAPETQPEDWDFSRQVRALGFPRLFATRKVAVEHEAPRWHTRRPWGTWKTDELHATA